MDNPKNKKVKNIIFTALSVLIIIAILAALLPVLSNLTTQQGRDGFKEVLTRFGVGGWFIFLSIQILQVIIAFIPGEPIEIMAGFMYSGFGGLLTCLLGIFIGSFAIYYTVKYLSRGREGKINLDEKLQKYKFLRKEKNLKLIVFLLFLIPGTPKDMLIYIAPFISIKPISFIAIATLARIPSIVTSTFAGHTIQNGNFTASVVIFIIAGALGISGIIVNDLIIKYKNKRKSEN